MVSLQQPTPQVVGNVLFINSTTSFINRRSLCIDFTRLVVSWAALRPVEPHVSYSFFISFIFSDFLLVRESSKYLSLTHPVSISLSLSLSSRSSFQFLTRKIGTLYNSVLKNEANFDAPYHGRFSHLICYSPLDCNSKEE